VSRPLLLLRPEPGASATAGRAAAIGLEAIRRPLFRIVARDWEPPGPVDAVMMTSANAARAGGGGLAALVHLPLYAVGEATGEAARGAGFADVRCGPGHVAALIERIRDEGVTRLLHLAGEDRTAFDAAGVTVIERIVYAAEPVDPVPDLADMIARQPVVLLHSTRAARAFAALVAPGAKGTIRVAAISERARAAAGDGWEQAVAAPSPDDDALLAVAARLCD